MDHRIALSGLAMMVVLWASGSFAANASNSACLECHDSGEAMLGFLHDANNAQCVDCHGESAEHADRPRNAPTITFDKWGDGELLNATCLGCHDNETRVHWESGVHGDANVSCAGCHSVHEKRDAVLVDRMQMEVCVDCHKGLVAQFDYPSHHPVEEGATKCSNCHATHGSANESSLTRSSVTETCVSCHDEKRGPFLFEHDPVTEDCGLCHKPHGSILPSLLTSRPPFLCQQCHMAAGHPSRLPDGTALNLNDTNLRGKGCVNCHSQVHGSNHPSGARLTR
jgi:DmsE family decaheme c-type cytochrome